MSSRPFQVVSYTVISSSDHFGFRSFWVWIILNSSVLGLKLKLIRFTTFLVQFVDCLKVKWNWILTNYLDSSHFALAFPVISRFESIQYQVQHVLGFKSFRVWVRHIRIVDFSWSNQIGLNTVQANFFRFKSASPNFNSSHARCFMTTQILIEFPTL